MAEAVAWGTRLAEACTGTTNTAVVDLAERMTAAALRGDVEGRERARREFGFAG